MMSTTRNKGKPIYLCTRIFEEPLRKQLVYISKWLFLASYNYYGIKLIELT